MQSIYLFQPFFQAIRFQIDLINGFRPLTEEGRRDIPHSAFRVRIVDTIHIAVATHLCPSPWDSIMLCLAIQFDFVLRMCTTKELTAPNTPPLSVSSYHSYPYPLMLLLLPSTMVFASIPSSEHFSAATQTTQILSRLVLPMAPYHRICIPFRFTDKVVRLRLRGQLLELRDKGWLFIEGLEEGRRWCHRPWCAISVAAVVYCQCRLDLLLCLFKPGQ